MAGISSSQLVNLFSGFLSGITSTPTSTPAVTSVAGWLANQFSSNHTMTITVQGLLNAVLTNVGNVDSIKALANDILAVPNLPPKVVGLVNGLAGVAASASQLETLVNQIRIELTT
jgi:hypothetical protein